MGEEPVVGALIQRVGVGARDFGGSPNSMMIGYLGGGVVGRLM